MFPWDRKSQVLQGGRKNGYRANSINERRDLSYMGGNSSMAPQSEYLPAINQSHQAGRGRDNSYLGPSSMEFQDAQEMPPDGYGPNNGRSVYSRSQSYSPFGGRNERVSHQQRNYARILEEQIHNRNAKKHFEKQKNLEIDKRMIEDGEFYKYFGRNRLEEKYRNQALLPSIESTTRNRYLGYFKHNDDIISIDARGATPIDGRLTPARIDNSPGYEYVSVNPAGVRYAEENNGDQLNGKTRDYLKKIEYKQALEQQILESNLKKKHESELRMLEDKIDELKGSYVRLKTKPTKDVSYEKLQGIPAQGVPVMINGSEVLLKPVDPYKIPSARRPYNANTKRYIPASELQLVADQNNRLRPILKGTKQSLDLSNDVNGSVMYPSTIMVDDGLINNYVTVQNELDKIKGDIRDHMTKMNDKLADLRTELGTHARSAHERDMMQLQVLKENPLLLGGPYEANNHYLPLPTLESYGGEMNPDESRHSLMHETQFVPVTDMATGKAYQPMQQVVQPIITAPDYNPLMDNLSTLTKKIDMSIQNQNQKFERDLAAIHQELRLFKKNEEEIQMEKMNEYVNLIGNFVGSTRKLERNLNVQQQKLNKEIGTIQDELKAFKANEQQFHMLKYNEYSPLVEDMVTLTKKLERSLNGQQQRLNNELGIIQQELRSLKMNNDQKVFVPMTGYDRVDRVEKQPDQIEKVEKLIDRIEKIQKTDDKYSLHDNLASVGARYNSTGYQNGGGDMIKGGKLRNRSQNIKHNKRGVKRVRDELPGESQQRA